MAGAELEIIVVSSNCIASKRLAKAWQERDGWWKGKKLELAFDEKSLRELCESEDCASRELGMPVASILKHRLADMRAATSVKDLVAGRPREITEAGVVLMAVDLCDGYRIVFTANHVRNPATAGGVDWAKVSRVKLLRIEEGHD